VKFPTGFAQLQRISLATLAFVCDDCGAIADRDANAATNLEFAAQSPVVSACGEECSGAVLKSRVKRSARKSEVSSEVVYAYER
jgi:transposase